MQHGELCISALLTYLISKTCWCVYATCTSLFDDLMMRRPTTAEVYCYVFFINVTPLPLDPPMVCTTHHIAVIHSCPVYCISTQPPTMRNICQQSLGTLHNCNAAMKFSADEFHKYLEKYFPIWRNIVQCEYKYLQICRDTSVDTHISVLSLDMLR